MKGMSKHFRVVVEFLIRHGVVCPNKIGWAA